MAHYGVGWNRSSIPYPRATRSEAGGWAHLVPVRRQVGPTCYPVVGRLRQVTDEERGQLELRLEEQDREAFLRWEEGESEREVVERENERYWESRYTDYLQSRF